MNKVLISSLLAVTSIAFLSGCASTSHSENASVSGSQAGTACPQCKSVLVQPSESYYMQWADEGYREPAYFQHECPGCQGALTTLFQEGKFEHKCSVCETGPYSCELFQSKKMTTAEQ
ncbi:hypothetical protein QEH59_12485 [Coraliomargarita sp. SDUM461004]|uniref:Uncharacterized protein n=1 Tax=Thalassobacterium sedimentorum TaxID=3041258 RepID=A0ABU1ANQ7_9BACT|nr:hypothetical protein [Coraliomargarita sp. SDUM461004]